MIICGKMDMDMDACKWQLEGKNVVALSIGKHQEHFFQRTRNIFFSRKNAAFVGFLAVKETLSQSIFKQFLLTLLILFQLNRFIYSSLSQFYLWFFLLA